jgi:hypothetical protein
MYARGILFGKMKFELGDHMYVRCPDLGLVADIEFKTKGYFGGTYNAIGGFIKDSSTETNLYELSGHWNEEIFIKNITVRSQTSVLRKVCCWLVLERLGKRSCSSTRRLRSRHYSRHGHLRNKTSGNRKNYGAVQSRPW